MSIPDLKITTVKTNPFDNQKPGTSGLRKKVTEFKQPNYTENFIQCTLETLEDKLSGCHLAIGGDGRYYNDVAVQTTIRICAANGVKMLTVATDAMMSTPAVSCVIRKLKLDGGLIFTASHNPGGESGDLGIKFNVSNGGPAPASFTDGIFERTKKIQEYKIVNDLKCDLSVKKLNEFKIDGKPFHIKVIDSVDDYVDMLQHIFDFPIIKQHVKKGFRFLVDCMHGITGLYAQRIFIEELGAPTSSVINTVPKEDFGGLHPDPNLEFAVDLKTNMKDSDFDLGVAFDGDGDRNMILGRNAFFVAPSDSLAILADNLGCIPHFRRIGVKGFARSMPTPAAVDKVAAKHKKPVFEVPTGWKFFGNLLDKDLISLCGEESFGTGSDHIREKDGIWAALAWLSVVSNKKMGVKDIVFEHWASYGRNYFCRWDYEFHDVDACNKMMKNLNEKSLNDKFLGESFGPSRQSYTVAKVENFEYSDPVDKSVSKNQGLRIVFDNETKIVFRLSGTGSEGATLRVYVDKYVNKKEELHKDAQEYLLPVMKIASEIAEIKKFTGKENPTLIV